MGRLRRLGFRNWIAIVALFLLAFLVVAEMTSTTEFCTSCHEEKDTLARLKKSSHWDNDLGMHVACKDCHIPPDVVGFVGAKLNGLRHAAIHLFDPPTDDEWDRERPHRQRRARESISDAACMRCHNAFFTPASAVGETAHTILWGEVRCAGCHTNLAHNEVPPHRVIRVKEPVGAQEGVSGK